MTQVSFTTSSAQLKSENLPDSHEFMRKLITFFANSLEESFETEEGRFVGPTIFFDL